MSDNIQKHPQWFIDQHTKLFHLVADDADRDLSRDITCETNMYHPHGITETAYRGMIWDLVFSGRRIHEERDALRSQLAEARECLATTHDELNKVFIEGGGCDHSVGICWCDVQRALDAARALLAKLPEGR